MRGGYGCPPSYNNKGETMIRVRNIDYESEGMKLHSTVLLGNISASALIQKHVFVAPFDCVLERIDIYNDAGTALDSAVTVNVFLTTATTALLNTAYAASATAGARIRFTPSANNSLTSGMRVSLSLQGTAADPFVDAVAICRYKPQKHRSVR